MVAKKCPSLISLTLWYRYNPIKLGACTFLRGGQGAVVRGNIASSTYRALYWAFIKEYGTGNDNINAGWNEGEGSNKGPGVAANARDDVAKTGRGPGPTNWTQSLIHSAEVRRKLEKYSNEAAAMAVGW